MYHLKLFDPYNTSEKELRAYYNCKVKREAFKQIPFDKTYEEWTHDILSHLKIPGVTFYIYLLFELDEVIGNIDVRIVNKGKTEEKQIVNLHLPNKYKAEYWDYYNLEMHLNEWKKRSKLTNFIAENNILIQQLKSIGFTTSNQMVFLKCSISDLNLSFINEVLSKNPVKENKLSFEILNSLPYKTCEDTAPLFTQLLNDMVRVDMSEKILYPADILYQDDQGRIERKDNCSYFLLRNKENKLIGINNVRLDSKNPKTIWQFMAGVTSEYRNKGITSWMKAYLYQKLIQEFPTLNEVRTDCYKDNAAIIHINQKMGLKVYKELTDMHYLNQGN